MIGTGVLENEKEYYLLCLAIMVSVVPKQKTLKVLFQLLQKLKALSLNLIDNSFLISVADFSCRFVRFICM